MTAQLAGSPIVQSVINQPGINATCHYCKRTFMLQRRDIAFWPDHLWVGAIVAMARCQCGRWASLGWAHDLPIEWQEDIPNRRWLQSCIPRLIYGCHRDGIPGDLLPEFAEIPYFGNARHPVPGQLYQFDAREGYHKNISLFQTITMAVKLWRKHNRLKRQR